MSRGIMRVSQLLTFLILARILTVEEFGWFGMVTSAIAMAVVLGSLGLKQATAHSVGQQALTSSQGASLLLLVLGPLVAVSGAAVLVWLTWQAPTSSEGWILYLIVGLGILAMMSVTLGQGLLLGRGQIHQYGASDAISRILLLAIVVILWLTGIGSLTTAMAAHVAGFAFAGVFLGIYLLTTVKLSRPPLGSLFRLIRYGSLFAVNLFIITLSARASMYIIEQEYDAAQAGQFFGAVRINEIFLEITVAIAMVLFSDAARNRSSESRLGRNVRVSCWVFWFFALLSCVVAIFAPQLTTLILGTNYSEAGPALRILAIGLAPAAATKIIYGTFAGEGRPGFGTPLLAGALCLNIGLAVWLVPGLGIVGGAVALVAGQLFLFLGYIVACSTTRKARASDFVVPRVDDVRGVYRSVSGKLRRRGKGGIS